MKLKIFLSFCSLLIVPSVFVGLYLTSSNEEKILSVTSEKPFNVNEEMIRRYQEKIAQGGGKEEQWFFRMMIGDCYEKMKLQEKAIDWYLEAYEQNPERREPLLKVASLMRQENKNSLAYMFAKQASRIPFPEHQSLSLSREDYDYKCDEEISIAAYYTHYKNDGFDATNRLALKRNIPPHVRDLAYKNLVFYLSPLSRANYRPIQVKLPEIREGLSLTYRPMNPSIKKTEEGYDLIVRAVNYAQDGGMGFRLLDEADPERKIRTKNFLVSYDKDLKFLSQKEIVDALPHQPSTAEAEGLEDCRVFAWKGAQWFTCTTYADNPHNLPHMALCKLGDEVGDKLNVEKFQPLKGPDYRRTEKNWLPLARGDELNMIYSYDPFTVYKPDLVTGESEVIVKYEPPLNFSEFRGSASPIALGDGYLLVVHERAFNDKRYYMHRFLYLDKDYQVQKLSKPFFFRHKGIEYCCGMSLDHSDKNLVLTLGVEDREAYLCTVGLENVMAMLESIDK